MNKDGPHVFSRMSPLDVPTNETLQFIMANVPASRQRILEVGCGKGRLARKLGQLGHEVIAIDSSPEFITAARRLGVDAREATFPQFVESAFDCVLFTRSLHHIKPVSSAVAQTAQLLKPSGVLLIEDFAFDEVDDDVANFFYAVLRMLDACGKLTAAEGKFARQLLEARGDYSIWQNEYHGLNSVNTMVKALRKRFQLMHVNSAPYFYRYVAEAVAPNGTGGRIVMQVLELEKKAALFKERLLIGRRFVGKIKET